MSWFAPYLLYFAVVFCIVLCVIFFIPAVPFLLCWLSFHHFCVKLYLLKEGDVTCES